MIYRKILLYLQVLPFFLISCVQESQNSNLDLLLLLVTASNQNSPSSHNTSNSSSSNDSTSDSSNQNDIPQAEKDAVVSINLTVGGNSYDLNVMRCSIGQNLTSTNCSGTVHDLQYCSENSNDCNGGVSGGLLVSESEWLNGESSSVWKACADLNTINGGSGFAGISNWRVPTCQDSGASEPDVNSSNCELRKLYLYGVNGNDGSPWLSTSPAKDLFPNTPGGVYWSASARSGGFTSEAWRLSFSNGALTRYFKNWALNHVRCVSDP
jgi:hypothetical protein